MRASVGWVVVVMALAPAVGAAQTLSFSAGHVGIADHLKEPQWYGVEYRGSPLSRWDVVPGVGYQQAACGAGYVYTTFAKTIWLNSDWAIMPYFGPGFWADSEQIQLGHRIQFRTGVDVVLRLDGNVTVGIGVAHLSNSSLGDLNPGTETLAFSLTIPI